MVSERRTAALAQRVGLLAVAAAILAACAIPVGPAAPRGAESLMAADARQQIVLTGELTRADHQTYREIPFRVPPGVARLTIELEYEGRDQRTVVDLGLRDPNGQRGWSGGNKSRIVVGEWDATPSYRAGPLTPGTWLLVLGAPNIREGVTSSFTAIVTLEGARLASAAGLGSEPLSPVAGWRRGDFHTHTGHSDASCDNDAGARIPCPVNETLAAARRAGLDFVAVTDHNTISQNNALRELQPAFSTLLAIPGVEITTFLGHANAIGVTAPLDFQLGGPRLPTLKPLLDQIDRQQAILSINHPKLPSGESCMGCGWTVADTDWSRVAAIEVVNGATSRLGLAEGPTSGVPFWEALLNAGHRITAIGGSDNHDPKDDAGVRQSPVGKPATLVWANDLSPGGVIDGVRSGRVAIDLENVAGRTLDMAARSASSETIMGGELALAPGEQAEITVSLSGVEIPRIEPITRNLVVAAGATSRTFRVRLEDAASAGWVRINVRSQDGRLLMLGNPVYLRGR